MIGVKKQYRHPSVRSELLGVIALSVASGVIESGSPTGGVRVIGDRFGGHERGRMTSGCQQAGHRQQAGQSWGRVDQSGFLISL